MGKAEGDLIPGTLDILILKALGAGALHGYAVAEWIHQRSHDVLQVDEGALYPALHRLELRGLLFAEWGASENNRRAKFYKLTAAGKKHLEAESVRWTRLSAAVGFVLSGTWNMGWQDLREHWFRILGLWRRSQRERELADEMEFHMTMKQQAGQSADQAKRQFGGIEKWKEVCRDVGRNRFMEDLVRDLALAVRMLRKSPVFTAVALITLTLAIGANTAIFSLMNEVMLKSLPVPNAKRLVILRIQPDENYGYAFSYPLFQAVQKRSASVMELFTYTNRTLQLRSRDGIETIPAQLVNAAYFSSLGLRPQMGRWIEPHDDQPGAPDGMVAVVSDHFWRSRMSSDPQILGKQITLNKGVFTVVGVMPKGFRGMDKDEAPDVFVPFQLEPFLDAPFNSISSGYQSWWFSVGGYLKDGVSVVQADAFMKTISRPSFQEVAPGIQLQFNGHKFQDLYMIAEPGESGMSFLRLRFRKPLAVVMGLVLMVLILACLNLATLLTARSASRIREITTRFALGASRARLLRQLLTESLLLAGLGTILGLAVSPLLVGFVAAMVAPQHGSVSSALLVKPDLLVFGFTALIAGLATVITGALPALRSTGSDLQAPMRERSNAIRGADRRQLWPRTLLGVEVALSLILVTGASLLGYSLVKLHAIPPGFESKGLIYLRLDMEKQSRKGKDLSTAYQNLCTEFGRIPGVLSASATSIVPLTGSWSSGDIKVPGGPEREAWRNTVGPLYFAAMHTPLLQGREFRWDDSEKSGAKVILNESAAKMLFPKGHPVGQHVTHGEDGKGLAEVIGVVVDAKYSTLKDVAPPTVYRSLTQDIEEGASRTLLIRSHSAPGPVITAARDIIRRIVPDIPAPVAFNMEDTVAESLATERVMATLALFFGGLALLITGVGLYGTLAYATERRIGEIGIRLALGAAASNVITLVCRENIAIAILGCIVGIGGSYAASKTIASFLYGVSAKDPLLFATAALALLLVATVASLVPALKASKIDPIAAIRYE